MPLKVQTKDNILYESNYEVYTPITFNKLDNFFYHHKQTKIFNKLLKIVDFKKIDIIHVHTLFKDGGVAY